MWPSTSWRPAWPRPSVISASSAGPTCAMIGRLVAEPAEPGRRPDEAGQPEAGEDAAPADVRLEQPDQRRRQPAEEERAGEEHALDAPALRGGDPAREGARGVRPGARLAGAEQEPHREHAAVAPHRRRGDGEGRPPADDPRQHPPRADALAPPRRRDLEERVGDGEGAEHVAHVELRQRQVAHDRRRQRRDADPIEVRDAGQAHGERDHAVADAAGGGSGRDARLGSGHVSGPRRSSRRGSRRRA